VGDLLYRYNYAKILVFLFILGGSALAVAGFSQAGPIIVHAPVSYSPPGEAVLISAEVTDSVGLRSALPVNLFVRRVSGWIWGLPLIDWQWVTPLTNIGGDTYQVFIPSGYVQEPEIEYYIYATNEAGEKSFWPGPSSGTVFGDYWQSITVTDTPPPTTTTTTTTTTSTTTTLPTTTTTTLPTTTTTTLTTTTTTTLPDSVAPTVLIESPENKTYLDDSVELGVSVDEVSTCSYSLDDLDYVDLGEDVDFSASLTSLSSGQHSLNVRCVDGAGNEGFGEVLFTSAVTRVLSDVDGDGELETAEDSDLDSLNGFENYTDPSGNSYLNVSIDADGDGMIDFLINYRDDDRPDVYWDPDNGIVSVVTYLDNGEVWVFDAGGDGIPDVAYNSSSGDVEFYDAPPVVIIYSPVDGFTYSDSSVSLEYWVSDAVSCEYSLDGVVSAIPNCTNVTIDGLSNRDYLLELFVVDSLGQNVSNSTAFTISVPAPPGPGGGTSSGGGPGSTFTLGEDEFVPFERVLFFNPPGKISVSDGLGEFVFDIQNTGLAYLEDVSVEIEGIPLGWYTVSPAVFDLGRNKVKKVTVSLDVPSGEYGEKNFTIIVLSESGVLNTLSYSLDLGEAPLVGVELAELAGATTTTTTFPPSPIGGFVTLVSNNVGAAVAVLFVGAIFASIGLSAHRDALRAQRKAEARKSDALKKEIRKPVVGRKEVKPVATKPAVEKSKSLPKVKLPDPLPEVPSTSKLSTKDLYL